MTGASLHARGGSGQGGDQRKLDGGVPFQTTQTLSSSLQLGRDRPLRPGLLTQEKPEIAAQMISKHRTANNIYLSPSMLPGV